MSQWVRTFACQGRQPEFNIGEPHGGRREMIPESCSMTSIHTCTMHDMSVSTHTCTHVLMHTHAYSHVHACIHTDAHTCIHTHAHASAHAHTLTHCD